VCDEFLVRECGGNGRQIVRCRDISVASARWHQDPAPDTGDGKLSLNL
jgi:hypothetical protein